jgi:hypothetical protein
MKADGQFIERTLLTTHAVGADSRSSDCSAIQKLGTLARNGPGCSPNGDLSALSVTVRCGEKQPRADAPARRVG